MENDFLSDLNKLEDKYRRVRSLDGQQSRTLDKKSEFITAYQKSCGNIRMACDMAGIKSRKTFYNWCEADPEFKKAIDSTLVYQQDLVQDMLLMKILKGDGASIRWFLKHNHHRYNQKKSTVPPHKPVDPWAKYDKLPWPEDEDEEEEDV